MTKEETIVVEFKDGRRRKYYCEKVKSRSYISSCLMNSNNKDAWIYGTRKDDENFNYS